MEQEKRFGVFAFRLLPSGGWRDVLPKKDFSCVSLVVPAWMCQPGCDNLVVTAWFSQHGCSSCASLVVPTCLCQPECASLVVPAWLSALRRVCLFYKRLPSCPQKETLVRHYCAAFYYFHFEGRNLGHQKS